MDWNCGDDWVVRLWSLDNGTAFLNNGSYGAVPVQVQNRRIEFLSRQEENPVRFLSRELPSLLERERNALAVWLNAEPDGLALIHNATSGLGAVLRSLKFDQHDEIVFHDHGYRWVKQALENLSRQCGVVVKTAEVPWPVVTTDEIVKAFEKQLTKRTKLIICDHITSASALVYPVEEIVSLAASRKIPVLVDGAHAPGALELDLKTLGADFYVGNLHKWACAPRGAGFLSVKPQFRCVIRPESLSYSGGQGYLSGGARMTDFFDWNGTTDVSSWLCISEALAFNQMLGWNLLRSNRVKLLNSVRELFFDTFQVWEQHDLASELSGPLWTVELPLAEGVIPSAGLGLQISQDFFEKARIEVPVFHFKDRICVRVSAQAFNQLNDYQRLVNAIQAHPQLAARKGVG